MSVLQYYMRMDIQVTILAYMSYLLFYLVSPIEFESSLTETHTQTTSHSLFPSVCVCVCVQYTHAHTTNIWCCKHMYTNIYPHVYGDTCVCTRAHCLFVLCIFCICLYQGVAKCHHTGTLSVCVCVRV